MIEASTPISVALPVHHATPWLESAFACVARQDVAELEILVVLNGSDDATRERVLRLARGDARVRVLRLPTANLAMALNAALREARYPLVARMDGDDACDRSRLRQQALAMTSDPTLAGVGCGYRVRTPDGRCVMTVRPPTEPGTLRWRLLLGNMLAHGSMMLRRDVVLGIGGYDESLLRSQDFDLWLRLARSHRLAALAEVLYDYRTGSASGADRSGKEQAANAARCMLREWRLLRERDDTDEAERVVAGVLCRDVAPEDAKAALAAHLSARGPTRETMLAWTWASAMTPSAPVRARMAARRALVREVTRELRRRGAERVWLYPGGAFVQSLLDTREDFAVPVAGVLDDHAAGSWVGGLRISTPAAVSKGEHVLIASDWHEDALWKASATLRARGVHVHRMHELEQEADGEESSDGGGRRREGSGRTLVDPEPSCTKLA